MNKKGNILLLEKIVREHPLFTVTDYKINPSVNKDSILSFKNKYGFDISPLLAKLYSEMNGFSLKYELKDSTEGTFRAFNKDKAYTAEEPPSKIGSIDFPSFEDVFLKDSWEKILYNTGAASDNKEFDFNGEKFTYNSFGEKLKPFDTYSDESCAAFVLTDKNRFDVILLEDNYVAWNDSRIMDFETYFKFILLTGGLIQARDIYFTELRGDKKPKFKIKKPESLIPEFFKKMVDEFLND